MSFWSQGGRSRAYRQISSPCPPDVASPCGGQGLPGGWGQPSRLCALATVRPPPTTPCMDYPELPEARPACPLVVRPWGVSCSCLTWLVFPGQQRWRRWRARQQPPEQRPLLGGADSPRGWYPSCPGPEEGRVADFVWEPRL